MSDDRMADLVTATAIVAADGSAYYDDIQDALTSVCATGGWVFVKDGTYTLDEPLKMCSHTRLSGAGTNTIITLADGVNDNIIENSDQVGGNEDITIDNLKLDGNGAAQAAGNGIDLLECDYSRFNNLWVYDCKDDGILCEDSDFDMFMENLVTDCAVDAGLNIDGGVGVVADSNIITGCGRAIELNGLGDAVISNNQLNLNGYGVYGFAGLAGRVISGNIMRENLIGIYLFGFRCTLSGNAVVSSLNHGMQLYLADSAIVGNTTTNNGTGVANSIGIILKETGGVYGHRNTIAGNTCGDQQVTETQKYGIEIEANCGFNYVGGNVCRGNTSEGINITLPDFVANGNIMGPNVDDG